MKKSVSGQVIGAQMVDATTGAAFTSAVTVYVTGDAGTQAVGSVGAGACTHEGNGYHTYAPAQAETNYDLVAFTFIGTGAVPATVQVYTTFPQTGDNFARLGAPAGASVSADVAAVKTQTAAIEVDTADIQTRLPAALVSGRMDSSVGAMAANTLTASALATDAVTEIQTGLSTLTAAAAADAVWDEVLADHLTAGSTGNALNAAGAAGDPWSTALPGAYGAGTAGKIVGDNINATISSRATQTSVDDVPTNAELNARTLATADYATAANLATVDTVVDAILVDTAEIGAAGAGLTALASAANLAIVASYIDTEIATIKQYADRTVVRGTVSGTAPTTTTFTSSALSPAGVAADQFKGRIIVFDNDTTTTALRGQATDITASSAAANPLFTFTALTTAPQSGDTFSIL